MHSDYWRWRILFDCLSILHGGIACSDLTYSLAAMYILEFAGREHRYKPTTLDVHLNNYGKEKSTLF